MISARILAPKHMLLLGTIGEKHFTIAALRSNTARNQFPDARGILHHLNEIHYGLSLLATAIRFRANWALLHSGSTHYFMMSLFRLAGIQVVPFLHNTLWPCGFRPTGLIQRLIMQLDSWFFRWSAAGAIGVSPECTRQVDQLTQGRHCALHEIRAQYCPDSFANVMPPPPFESRPFRILFLGRIDTTKGATDILQIARKIEDRAPDRVHWDICGTGPSYNELRQQYFLMNLETVVSLHGWALPEDPGPPTQQKATRRSCRQEAPSLKDWQ